MLREAVADFLRRTRPGLDVDADNIICMPGGKPVIFHTIAALCEEGDEVIFPDPGRVTVRVVFGVWVRK